MKLIRPFVSSTAKRMSSSEPIDFWRASARISSTVMRSRRRLRSRIRPSAISSVGSPSSSGRSRLKRKLSHAVRDEQHGERGEHRRRAGQRVVALRDALLDEVADHHEQDQVERLHRAQLAPPDRARDHEDEHEDERGAQDEIHGYGSTVSSRSIRTSGRVSSSSSMPYERRPGFVGSTWNCSQIFSRSPGSSAP